MRTLALGLLVAATGAGCIHLQPTGPFANSLPGTSATKADDAPVPEPVVRQAPKPTPPALYVTPAEVTP